MSSFIGHIRVRRKYANQLKKKTKINSICYGQTFRYFTDNDGKWRWYFQLKIVPTGLKLIQKIGRHFGTFLANIRKLIRRLLFYHRKNTIKHCVLQNGAHGVFTLSIHFSDESWDSWLFISTLLLDEEYFTTNAFNFDITSNPSCWCSVTV